MFSRRKNVTMPVTTRSASGPSRPPVAFRRTRRIPMATGIRVSATPIGHGSPVDGMEYTLAKWTAVHSQAERWPLTRPPRRRVRRREVSRTAGSSWIGRGHPLALTRMQPQHVRTAVPSNGVTSSRVCRLAPRRDALCLRWAASSTLGFSPEGTGGRTGRRRASTLILSRDEEGPGSSRCAGGRR